MESARLETLKLAAQEKGYNCSENGELMTVEYSLLITNETPNQTFGGYAYAAFNSEGDIIAIGSESGDNRSGGWTWIRGRFDNRCDKDTQHPPETIIYPPVFRKYTGQRLPAPGDTGFGAALHIIDDRAFIDPYPQLVSEK